MIIGIGARRRDVLDLSLPDGEKNIDRAVERNRRIHNAVQQ